MEKILTNLIRKPFNLKYLPLHEQFNVVAQDAEDFVDTITFFSAIGVMIMCLVSWSIYYG